MQVVYLGSSPAAQRRYGSPRMIRPCSTGSIGYSRPPAYPAVHHGALYSQRSVDSHSSYTNKRQTSETKLKDSIPAMAKSVAVFCLILNIICPGLGTFISACSVFCCAVVRPSNSSKCRVFFINVGVALLQFFTAFIFLLGWIWSIMWGAAFLETSDNFYKKEPLDTQMINNKNRVQRPKDLKIKTKNNNIQTVRKEKRMQSPTIVLHEAPQMEPHEMMYVNDSNLQLVPKDSVNYTVVNAGCQKLKEKSTTKEFDVLFAA